MAEPVALPRRRAAAARGRRGRSPLLYLGYGMLGVLVVVAVVAPLVLHDAATGLSGDANSGSTGAHPLGTDGLGRDMLARTLVATRQTLIAATLSTALAAVLGIGLGVATWLAPRRVREVGLRLIEFWVSYPTLLVAIIVAAVLGQGLGPAVVAIGIANAGGFARLTANLVAGLAAREYVVTARLMGVPPGRIAVRHLIPNMAEPQLILVAQAFAGALVELSGLSFIGLGAQSPAFDWGALLNEGASKIYTNPVLIVGPSVALVFASLAALFVGDGLAAAANPRTNTSRSRLVRRADAAAEPLEADVLLAVDHLTVRHDASGRDLVSDVSLRIRRGEILGIVGESGSGKSVTASVVSKLLAEGLTATAARVELSGADLLGRVPGPELARRVAMVYQDPGTALNPALTLGNQLTDVLTSTLGSSRRDARENLVGHFRDVLLTDPEGRMRQYPHQLSGGMKQRAMIASAMSTRAELLVADEPTTALDVTVQREVLGLIKRMNTTAGTSVLFISHDLGVVRALCDRVLVMKDGRIVETIDDVAHMTTEAVRHPYTRQLLAATPVVHTSRPEVEGADR
ncbi:dipeptide/oligopeptide/nickel ABC transporter permease/ATP-binding protein [Nocardioides mangrovi]|uniref:Dipeptide/oligopeptide/nickel ABC transporter permease/ATP-binding protein n=1 Tax=Nocardioides mangrovi TaxID=2874580 RepID=A0ABS7UED0_9ACTN|nr:dipeptide/oligopeptide/nickel ABC transporter permease/ATP-binding protein [Nocardioides mangrovi]MBZ5739360.1 dipeptide/oligopeptide/nickel ABC transporter permease/ATP-binding protein [Nocardioides mangrovi]